MCIEYLRAEKVGRLVEGMILVYNWLRNGYGELGDI